MVRHSGLPSELVLRAAARTDTGNYSCVAENSHGLGESGTLAVSVEFAPACVRAAPQRVAISVHESIDLECAVTSRPGNVRWSLTQGDYDGSGQRSCKCNYVDFSSEPCPHADTAWAVVG